MKLLLSLTRIWITPFYRRNAGFFLFFFFLFFGTVSPSSLVGYHLALIQSILSSYTILTGVLILWLLYNYKCTKFIYTSLKKEEGAFLYQLQALPFKRQLVLFSLLQVLLFLPVGAYILVVVGVAWQQGHTLQAILLLLYLFIICIGSSVYYCRLVNNTWKETKPLFTFPISKTPKPKGFLLVLVHLSLNKKKIQLGVLKLLSFIVLYIALVWNGDRYDHDSLVLFLVLLTLSHALLAFQYVQFIEKKLLFLRNLPLPAGRLFLTYYITFALLFLPELFYISWTGYQLIPWWQITAVYFTLVNTLVLYTTVQYSGAIDRNEFIKIAFGTSFVSIFFFNSEQYVWWAVLTLLCATLIFFTSYGQYEPPPEA